MVISSIVIHLVEVVLNILNLTLIPVGGLEIPLLHQEMQLRPIRRHQRSQILLPLLLLQYKPQHQFLRVDQVHVHQEPGDLVALVVHQAHAIKRDVMQQEQDGIVYGDHLYVVRGLPIHRQIHQ